MISLLEIYRRAENGPAISGESFDLDVVYATAHKVCEKYNIVYTPQNPVPSDDDLADRTFLAAVDFVVEAGIYCPDTGRVIKFCKDEVYQAIADAPGHCTMGEDKDRFTWMPQKPDNNLAPWYHIGAGITVSDERILFNLAKAYTKIEQTNSVSIAALEKIDGQTVKAGTPTEILAGILAVKTARQALCQSDRPGLAIGNCIAAAGTEFASIAASDSQFGLRNSDGWLVGTRAEMKISIDTLNKAAYLSSRGVNIGNEGAPLVGGYAGGPAGAAVLNVAYALVGRLVFNCDYHLLFPFHITKSCTTCREVLWPVALSGQAISRNTKELVWMDPYCAAGPMTKQYFYEAAAYVASTISSGVSLQACHPARAILKDHITPMEMLGSAELIEACIAMNRTKANELAKELLKKYEDNIDDAPTGKRYQDCYGMNTGEPDQEYVELYGEVKDELRGMGFNFTKMDKNL